METLDKASHALDLLQTKYAISILIDKNSHFLSPNDPSPEALFHLIRLCLTFSTLDIYSWVSSPRCFIYMMTRGRLSWLTKILLTDFTPVIKTNPFWVMPHYTEDFLNISHKQTVSLLILVSVVKEVLFERHVTPG